MACRIWVVRLLSVRFPGLRGIVFNSLRHFRHHLLHDSGSAGFRLGGFCRVPGAQRRREIAVDYPARSRCSARQGEAGELAPLLVSRFSLPTKHGS